MGEKVGKQGVIQIRIPKRVLGEKERYWAVDKVAALATDVAGYFRSIGAYEVVVKDRDRYEVVGTVDGEYPRHIADIVFSKKFIYVTVEV